MGFGFKFVLRLEDGEPAGVFLSAVPRWHVGEEFEARGRQRFRIVEIDDQPPPGDAQGVWTVERLDGAEAN